MHSDTHIVSNDRNVLAAPLLAQVAVLPRQVEPVLEFPEVGLDDSAAYGGYCTRFYRDAAGNAFQIYMDRSSGRVVHVWANALNESAGFTVRGLDGQPARPEWASGAWVTATGEGRTVEYELQVPASVTVGHFLLGSMRVERDFQQEGAHLEPFTGSPFGLEPLVRLIENLGRLDEAERKEHLALLAAEEVAELSARLEPALSVVDIDAVRVLRLDQPSFDGRHRMVLELVVDRGQVALQVTERTATLRSLDGSPVRLRIRVMTDARALSPLTRHDIFNADFFRFYESERDKYEQALAVPESERSEEVSERIVRFRRMERAVRAAELLAYREKLMAGLPNYATYFGRDTLVAALMLEPVWTEAMIERVIASVLRRLSPAGEVSHEEALGGQAIRENATVYNALIEQYLRGGADPDVLLERAREVLGDLQAVRENYRMVDDDYQFPVFVARYLSNPAIAAERKRAFLEAPAREGAEVTRLTLLLRNLDHVAKTTSSYVRNPVPANLIAFPARGDGAWFPGSWRDSGSGYASGRYAMDVNAVWVPHALEAIDTILIALNELGYGPDALEHAVSGLGGGGLAVYVRDRSALLEAIRVWRGAERHFEVVLEADVVDARVGARLAALPEAERSIWERVLRADPLEGRSLVFLALSLDAEGRPIPVASSDPATALFLDDRMARIRTGAATAAEAFRDLDILLLPYPIGLLIEGVGPVATNDAYAHRAIWEAFERDHYHSPRTIWGREVNLLLLGLERQVAAAFDSDGRPRDASLEPVARALTAALRRVLEAVDASGLRHNELWSYRVVDGRVAPVRYATSTDIQLWNITDLAVHYRLSRLPALEAAISSVGADRASAAASP